MGYMYGNKIKTLEMIISHTSSTIWGTKSKPIKFAIYYDGLLTHESRESDKYEW